MNKETFYFSHDYNARSDNKIKKLITKFGFAGYGLYWAIVEDLYQNANALQTDYECIAYDMRTKTEIIKSIIEDFDLFKIEGNYFGSLSIQRRIEERDAKSQKARQSAFYRWNKDKENANALQTHSEGNAIYKSKGNKIKVKEIKEDILQPQKSKSNYEIIKQKKQDFIELMTPFKEQYSKQMLNDFFAYWTEANIKNGKIRKDEQKFFDMAKRLATWKKRSEPTQTTTQVNSSTFKEIKYDNEGIPLRN